MPNKKEDPSLKDILDKKIILLKKEISKLSYEESMEKLDSLLNELSNETIPLDDIQNTYLKGNLYLERCQTLLENFEETITYLDSDTFIVDENINSVNDN